MEAITGDRPLGHDVPSSDATFSKWQRSVLRLLMDLRSLKCPPSEWPVLDEGPRVQVFHREGPKRFSKTRCNYYNLREPLLPSDSGR